MKISKRLKFLLKFMCIPIYVAIVVGILLHFLGLVEGSILLILSFFALGSIVMLGWIMLMGFIITVRKI